MNKQEFYAQQSERLKALKQKAKPPEVLLFVTVAKTKKAKSALRDHRREYETINGFIRFRTSQAEQSQMERGKITRLGILRNLGVY